MSIQTQIDRLNNAKSEIASAISSKGVAVAEGTSIDGLPALIRSIPQEGGSSGGTGSGIIEVPELPTENIDENAVYRVVVNTENEVYVIKNGEVYTAEQYSAATGMGYKVYFVDELPSNMEVTSQVLHLYVLNSNGIGYLDLMMSGNTQQIGTVLFGSTEYDRGYTNKINAEVLDGIYVTRSFQKEDWFIRENGKWRQISPDVQAKTVEIFKFGVTEIKPDEGKVLGSVAVDVKVASAGDFIDESLEEITEEHFRKSNGKYCYFAKAVFERYENLKRATIHKDVMMLQNTFQNCTALETVTFRGTPTSVVSSTFSNCPALTTINVPWGYTAVSGAPWGATNATINYNYTGE